MKRFLFVPVMFALVAWMAGGCRTVPNESAWKRFRFEEEHMGAWWSLTLYAPEEPAAREAAQAAFAKVRELDERLSDYALDSELSLLRLAQTGQPRPVSPILFRALAKARDLSRQTGGAFDLTVGPSIRLWRTARQARILPAETERLQAVAAVGWSNVVLDSRASTVTFTKPGMRIDLGGVAKGMGADAALRELRRRGFPRAMVAASGDLALGEAPPGKAGWTVGIAALDGREGEYARLLVLKNCGVSTSGDTEQYVTIAGTRYSHIVDPRTGIGLTNRIQATVIAPNATESDAFATALCVKGPEAAIRFIDARRGTHALVITANGGQRQEMASRNFSALPVVPTKP
jgi:thiamine biosynthesis lipoprotein